MKLAARRWPWLLLLIPVVWGAARLRFDVEVLNLLPADLPAVQGLKLYQTHFANADELIIAIQSADPDATELAARSIAETLRQKPDLIREAVWQPPWQESPAEAAEFVAYLWLNQPPAVFRELTGRLRPDTVDAQLQSTRQRLATSMSPEELARLGYDPFALLDLPEAAVRSAQSPFGTGENVFASADSTFRLVFVQAKENLLSYRDCMEWLQQVKALVAQTEIGPAVVQYTGRPAFVAEIAGGMERDIHLSVLGTLGVIIALFWWAHRRWLPLIFLVLLLVLILGSTFALGGLLFGSLNVVSAGFAAILLGLAVDYALVLYQEHLVSPGETIQQIRRKVGPAIRWSAATTAGAFALLNFGGMPGLAQLGSLVAIGVLLSALVMHQLFLPAVLSIRQHAPRRNSTRAGFWIRHWQRPTTGWAATVLLLILLALLLFPGFPGMDATPHALRPRDSAAYATLEIIKKEMGQAEEPIWVLVTGHAFEPVRRTFARLEESLRLRVAQGDLTLPTSMLPHVEHQRANVSSAEFLVRQRPHLIERAMAQGFRPEALRLTEVMLNFWERAANADSVALPANRISRWILDKFLAVTPQQVVGAGLLYPPTADAEGNRSSAALAESNLSLARDDFGTKTFFAGWDLLGEALLGVAKGDAVRVALPIGTLIVVALSLAFRGAREVLLSATAIGVSALGLLATMKLAGWSWNLMNLMALPLLLGAGVDYSIHMQLGLRRHRGDFIETWRSVGRALFLCSASTAAGFGSLAWSGNSGLASLGQICATGIGWAFFVSTFLLPIWWKRCHRQRIQENENDGIAQAPRGSGSNSNTDPSGPSGLYRADLWRGGLFLARRLPESFARHTLFRAADAYSFLNATRREIVMRNLLPALNSDRAAADKISRQLFRNFAGKLFDLWRYESGMPIDHLFSETRDWERYEAAAAKGRGVLLLTPHLGNWEFGGPLLVQRGVKLKVITLMEPDVKLTALRQAARQRWGIETFVIGQNPFAFVEVIRALEAGATIALLMDRPPAASAVTVTLFGRPFLASVAAAELARASGCALLPVYLPRLEHGYSARMLPEIVYDRKALGARKGRIELTQQIMAVFEPVISAYLSQWYHFVPIWPESEVRSSTTSSS